MPDVINGYKNMFAWMIRDIRKYDKPKAWRPTPGAVAVTFCKIRPGPEEPEVNI